MTEEPGTAMQQLTDTALVGPAFFIAAVPWTRTTEAQPDPERRISVKHTTQTLADYATLEQLNRHVSTGYTSLLIGQRIGLVRAGELTDAWPLDDTGWPWQGERDQDAAWAFRSDSRPGLDRPGASWGLVVADGILSEVIDAAAAASLAAPEATIVVARKCNCEPHWH